MVKLAQQIRGQVVVEQVHEPPETFQGSGVGAGPMQQCHEFSIDVGTAGVGPLQHLANHRWAGQAAKQQG